MLTAENKRVKCGLSILKFLEGVQLPKRDGSDSLQASYKGYTEVKKGNKANTTAKRAAQSLQLGDHPSCLKGEIHAIIPQSTERKT